MKNARTLKLDQANAKWLGVCAGVARFLEVEPWTVRLVFLGCLLFGGWFLVPLYFVAWYLLDENSGELRNTVMENQMVKHFRSVDYRKKLYRNTQEGKLWGVCAGIADYLELSTFTVRLVFVVLTCMTFFPVFLYLGALLVLEKRPLADYGYEAKSRTFEAEFKREPAAAPEPRARTTVEDDKRDFARTRRQERAKPQDSYSQRREFQYCARKFAALQQRLARLEAYVTSPRFKLQREFRSM